MNKGRIADAYIIILGGSEQYDKCFTPWGVIHHINSQDIQKEKELLYYADLVVFTGGSDVDPNLYGERKHETTHPHPARDSQEAYAYGILNALGTKMVGICRGAQFLTVMNGGKLVQNVSNHALHDTHEIRYVSSKLRGPLVHHVQVTSTHHQMMYPWSMPMKEFMIVAYAQGISHLYQGLPEMEEKEKFLTCNQNEKQMEPEVVWYPLSCSLAAQFHPEMMDVSSEGFQYYQDLLGQYIFNEEGGNK